jgi:UDP-N-acetylmuramoyl-L-alanyl-D-glutamate--2,6-diaminopimelate ligase
MKRDKEIPLSILLSPLENRRVIGNPDVAIRGIAYHSRSVEKGFLFAAICGNREDGKRYIPEAIERGAGAILVDEPIDLGGAVQVIVPDVREALARMAAAFYGDPSAALTVIGITGTNGKTTVSYLLEAILKEGGWRVGVMGTVNYRFGGRVFPAPTTTPESLDLQRHLAAMREAGMTHAVLEVSSHGLDLQRVRACDFDGAVFTNLSRDHLDYHGTIDRYFQAKRLLFTQSLRESRKRGRFAAINVDDPRGEELTRVAEGEVWSYAVEKRAQVWPEAFSEGPQGLRARIRTPRGALEVVSPLLGRHNLYNILSAVATGEALGIPHEVLSAGILRLRSVPGRLEPVGADCGIRVYVDYAHTPDALERALHCLRPIAARRLLVVFGCGGDRDRGKRPAMGEIAARGSDLAVITSDNPRTEDPLAIIEEIEKGMAKTGAKKLSPEDARRDPKVSGYLVLPDRKEAIQWAIQAAQEGDLILIAGKGHEDYQIIGERKIHFDDREEAAAALKTRERQR